MRKLLLLPVTLPIAAARGALTAVVETVVDALADDLEAPPAPSPTRAEPAPPPEPPAPEPPIKIHDDEPTRGEVNRRRVEQREGGAVGAEVRVDAPWEGYDAMSAREVLDRLVGADEATLAVVRLYESSNRNRATVLRAAEG